MIRQTPDFGGTKVTQTKRKTSKTLRKAITVYIYNVRIVKQIGKLHQLLYRCAKNNIDLVAIQEHRWQTQEQIGTHCSTLNNAT